MKTVFAQNVDIENSINLNNIFLNINKVLLNNHKSTFIVCAGHGTNLTGESPVTGIYRQV